MNDVIIAVLIVVIVITVGLGIGMWMASMSCEKAWKHSGLLSSWGPLQGCLVMLPDGRWLPSDRVREIDIKPK